MKINQKLILFLLAIGLLCPALAEAQTADTLTEEQTRKYEYYFLESIRLKMQQKYDAAFDMLQHCVSVMPNAVQIARSVESFGSALRTYKLFSVDCVSIASIARLLTDHPRCLRNSSIRSNTSMICSPLLSYFITNLR